MAIIMETRARNGVTIRFDDDFYAGRSPEEIERAWRLRDETATDIAETTYKSLPPEERAAYLRRIAGPKQTREVHEG